VGSRSILRERNDEFRCQTVGPASIGLDSNTLAAALAAAKVPSVSARQVIATAQYILHKLPDPASLSKVFVKSEADHVRDEHTDRVRETATNANDEEDLEIWLGGRDSSAFALRASARSHCDHGFVPRAASVSQPNSESDVFLTW
jgi:hypothetical protein